MLHQSSYKHVLRGQFDKFIYRKTNIPRYAVIGVNSFNSNPDIFARISANVKLWIKGIAPGARDSNCDYYF